MKPLAGSLPVKDALTISNDGEAGLEPLLRSSLGHALGVCKPGAVWYVAAPAGPQFLAFARVLTDLGVWRQTLAWVKDSMVLRIPEGLEARSAMAIGTAGFTAALCVLALQEHGTLGTDRELVVTGAAGGVGSIAVALLAALGKKVVASTGRTNEAEYLRKLGAADLIGRDVLSQKGPPLASERWGGGVDTVGGQTLVTLCSQVAYRGAVAACGLAGGSDFPGTVFPFILRNVALLGCDSDMTPMEVRTRAWDLLVKHVGKLHLEDVTQEVPMSRLVDFAPRIVDGQVRGRVVVNVNV